MERKPKNGLSVLLLIGTIYASLGGLFLVLGFFLTFLGRDSDAKTTGSIFILIGGIFFVLGIFFLAVEARRRRQIRALLEANRYAWGEVIDLSPNPSIRINGQHPYIARVMIKDSRGVAHVFKSRSLRTHPGKGIIGKQVKVYYLDETYKVYYVDIDPVLPHVIEH